MCAGRPFRSPPAADTRLHTTRAPAPKHTRASCCLGTAGATSRQRSEGHHTYPLFSPGLGPLLGVRCRQDGREGAAAGASGQQQPSAPLRQIPERSQGVGPDAFAEDKAGAACGCLQPGQSAGDSSTGQTLSCVPRNDLPALPLGGPHSGHEHTHARTLTHPRAHPRAHAAPEAFGEAGPFGSLAPFAHLRIRSELELFLEGSPVCGCCFS